MSNRLERRPAGGRTLSVDGVTEMATDRRHTGHRSRVWWFRIGAVVLGPLLFLLVSEGVLRLAGYGHSAAFFLGRSINGQAALITNPEFGKRFFPPGLARPPRPMALPAVKPVGTRRVFVLGESAAMGDPDPRFGLPRLLEVLLRERFPERPVEVVNAAVVAINSHVVLPIARECAAREGDVWVVYMGNNEMIGPFGPITVFGWQAPPWPLVRANLALRETRVGQALDAVLRTLMRRGGEARDWAGMSMMADQRLGPDDPRLARAYANFDANLDAILEAARKAGVPVILCTVATNIRDCAPFASVHRGGLTAAELAEWDRLYQKGVGDEAQGDFSAAAESYRQAAALDGDFADLSFRWAGCCLQSGQTNEASRLFRRARDSDALQFRADGRLNDAIRRAAARRAGADARVQLLDAEEWFASRSPGGAAGNDFFYEHVHLNPTGNHVLACAVADRVAALFGGGQSRPEPGATSGKPGGSSSGVGSGPVVGLGVGGSEGWLSEKEGLRRLGFTEWNRHHVLVDILGRVKAPPFTQQLNHERDVRRLETQIESSRLATKPISVRRAVEEVTIVVERHPDEPDVRWNLAELLEAEGGKAPAEAQWREVLRRWPQAIVPAYNLARLLESGGRGEEATAVYRQCLASDPDYFEARLALGNVLVRLGRAKEALEHLQRAVVQKPRSPEVHLAYGAALAQAGSRAAAKGQFEEVVRLDPGNAEVRQRLATP